VRAAAIAKRWPELQAVKGSDLAQFEKSGVQVILDPPAYKTGHYSGQLVEALNHALTAIPPEGKPDRGR
jgi:hypothetical protein